MLGAVIGSVARSSSSSNARTAARMVLTVVAVEAWRVGAADAMQTGGSSLHAWGVGGAWFGAEAIIQSMAGG